MEYFLMFLAGWVCGSLVNYLADTLPWKRTISVPFCIHCQEKMNLWNYFIWPRRCESCGKKRDWGVTAVELLTAITFALMWAYPPAKLGVWWGAIVIIYFGVIVVIDIRYKLILHITSWVGLGLGLTIGILLHGWIPTIEGGIIGYCIMFTFYKLGELFIKWWTRYKGKPEDEVALGFGDVNLSGILGLMVGFPGVLLSLFIGALIGGIVSLVYLVFSVLIKRYKALTALPYGPFLVCGAVIVIFFLDFLGLIFR